MREFDENVILESDDIILRYLKEEDAHAIFHNINNDREVLRYYVDRYVEKEEDFSLVEMIRKFKESEKYIFAIVLKDNNIVIGNILQCNRPNAVMNTVELGYAIGKAYWNKGYMTKALKMMIEFMFENGVHKVTSCHITDNKASGRVMEKCGMIKEGIKIDDIYYRDRYWDTVNYYILNSR